MSSPTYNSWCWGRLHLWLYDWFHLLLYHRRKILIWSNKLQTNKNKQTIEHQILRTDVNTQSSCYIATFKNTQKTFQQETNMLHKITLACCTKILACCCDIDTLVDILRDLGYWKMQLYAKDLQIWWFDSFSCDDISNNKKLEWDSG